jgi:hypothetical protein
LPQGSGRPLGTPLATAATAARLALRTIMPNQVAAPIFWWVRLMLATSHLQRGRCRKHCTKNKLDKDEDALSPGDQVEQHAADDHAGEGEDVQRPWHTGRVPDGGGGWRRQCQQCRGRSRGRGGMKGSQHVVRRQCVERLSGKSGATRSGATTNQGIERWRHIKRMIGKGGTIKSNATTSQCIESRQRIKRISGKWGSAVVVFPAKQLRLPRDKVGQHRCHHYLRRTEGLEREVIV